MNNLLITAGTTGLALRAKNMLADHFTINLGSSADIPSVLKNKIIGLPESSSPSFVHEILKIALDNNFSSILPLEANEILNLSKSIALFKEYGINILTPSPAHLAEIETITNPDKSMALTLLIAGLDISQNLQTDLDFSGFGILSDSTQHFLLVVAQ